MAEPGHAVAGRQESRSVAMNLNNQDREELFPRGLDVDAGGHGIWFGSQGSGALKLVAGEVDSETVVRGVVWCFSLTA